MQDNLKIFQLHIKRKYNKWIDNFYHNKNKKNKK